MGVSILIVVDRIRNQKMIQSLLNILVLTLTSTTNPPFTATFSTTNPSETWGSLIQLSTNTYTPAVSWSAQLVTANTTLLSISSASSATKSIQRISPHSARLQWKLTEYPLTVSLLYTLTPTTNHTQPQLEVTPTFTASDNSIGLWRWTVFSTGTQPVKTSSKQLLMKGFGVVQSPPVSWAGIYPAYTSQYLATWDDAALGTYTGAHDRFAHTKTFGCSVTSVAHQVSMQSCFVQVTPPNAGVPLFSFPTFSYTPSWSIRTTTFSGDWWEASQIYAQWVLPNAKWTEQGPLSKRTDTPAWVEDMTVWVNTHWQGNDIFNVSGGDPTVVLNRVAAITERFQLDKGALGLHWYEWDLLGYEYGSNYTTCTDEDGHCGFDTHYPEYFPERLHFNTTLKELQEKYQIRVTPYVNGRIFDTETKAWKKNNYQAKQSSAKFALPGLGGQTNITEYEESYGSQVNFALMCPNTTYWQNEMSKVVGTLTNDYGTDGVYIDQISCATPKPCFDKTHNHSLGGGNHWFWGYQHMLEQYREQVGNDKLLLSESNGEPYMNGLNMYLTLVGFASGDLSPPPPSSSSFAYIVPAFQSIYGGYIYFMGAEFFQQDFVNPNVFAAKVANQMLFGAQIGWFSLGGRNNQHPPMGVYNELMDEQYNAEILYLQLLATTKKVMKKWLTHGHAMKYLTLVVNGSAVMNRTVVADQPRSVGGGVGVAFDAVLSTTWMDASNTELLILITTVERDSPAVVTATFDASHYGFVHTAETTEMNVYLMANDGKTGDRLLGSYPRSQVAFNVRLDARAMVVLRVELK